MGQEHVACIVFAKTAGQQILKMSDNFFQFARQHVRRKKYQEFHLELILGDLMNKDTRLANFDCYKQSVTHD